MELTVLNTKIAELRGAESTVKALVTELVPVVMARIHQHNDVDSANRFVLALSDLNRKKVLSFMSEFSGHKQAEGVITGKKKPYESKDNGKVDPYQECRDAYDAFVETGMNFWQWCAIQGSKKEAKPVTVERLQKKAAALEKEMKEALAAGIIDRTAAVQMLVGNIMTQKDIIDVLGAMVRAEDAVTKAAAPTPDLTA